MLSFSFSYDKAIYGGSNKNSEWERMSSNVSYPSPPTQAPISERTGTVTVIRSPTRFPRDKSDAHPVHLISLSLRMTSARYKHYQRHKGAWDVPIVHCVKLNVSRHRSVSHIIVFRKWTCDTEILDRSSLTLFVFLRPRFHLPHGLPHLQGRSWQGDDNCSSQSVGALLRREESERPHSHKRASLCPWQCHGNIDTMRRMTMMIMMMINDEGFDNNIDVNEVVILYDRDAIAQIWILKSKVQ